MKHTKGPWTIEVGLPNTFRIRADLSHRKHKAIEESVAIITGSSANAALIAAAPEMLDVLEALLESVIEDHKNRNENELENPDVLKALKIIKKAKSES